MVKTLLKRVRQYKKTALCTPLVMIGEASMEILIPYVMTLLIGVIEGAQMSGTALGGEAIGRIALYGGVMILMSLVSLSCGVLGGKLASKASAGFAANLREDMYGKIQTYSFANIDKFSASSLITRMTTDVNNVQQSFQMCIRMLVRAPILFIFASIMSFVIAPQIAWMFIVAAVVLVAIVLFLMSKVNPVFREMFKRYDKLNLVTQENLTGIRVVKAYVSEGAEIDKFQKASQEVYDYSVKAEKVMVTVTPVVQLIMYATMIILLSVGGVQIIGGQLGVNDLTGLLSYSTQILSGVMMAAMCLTFVAMSRPAMERIAEVLNEEPTIVNPENPVMEIPDGSVDFEHVDFAYVEGAKENILSDINLHIDSGMTVGIIGGTGSAKSTLVSLIARLYDVKSGSVKVGGVDVRNYDLTVLRDGVAMVLQKNVLFSGSIAENLRWGKEDATQEELEFVAKQACADEFISRIPEGYDYDLGQGGVNVSGGQKQRLCIARALLKNPKVIVFDDSTSAVDTKTDALIRAALKKNAPEVTKIFIAQRIASVQDADLIVVLDRGRVVNVGKHDELMQTSEIYRGVYLSQNKGGNPDGNDE